MEKHRSSLWCWRVLSIAALFTLYLTATETVFAQSSPWFKTEGAQIRLIALPSMQRWITAGLAETWRDREHEEEWQQVGTLVEDRRATAD